MRFLDQAIEEKIYESSDVALRSGSWDDFEKAIDDYKVFLFGTGEGADFVFRRYGDSIRFDGAIDNDSNKWGKSIASFITYLTKDDLLIHSPEVIKNVAKECVVLITSIRYCDDIYSQLKNTGVQHIYSLLHMEANRRLSAKEDGYDKHPDERIIFAKECLNREINNKKIILARDGLAGHGKQIFKILSRCNLELDLVWVKEKEDAENISGVRTILQSDWKSYIEELETAHIWIFGDMIPEYAIKRPGQIYIHVKHWASITLKSFYFHLKQHLETKSIYDYYRHNTDAMDYCMVGSDFDEETCRTGFDFNGEFVRVGSPRSDVLFQDGVREKVYDHLGINEDIHTLLYAPTFRSKSSTTLIGCMREVDLDFEILKAELENRFGGEWRILLRIHPDVAIESKKVNRPEYVLDVSDYPDSEELVAASDIMISDYSSIMFEPAFVKKPVFLYAPDADEYIANDRELLLDYFSLPFAVSKSNEELGKAIALFDENKYVREVNAFLNRYGVNEDGHASERAAEFIKSWIGNSRRMNEIGRVIDDINGNGLYDRHTDLWINGLSDEISFWVNEFYKDKDWWEEHRGYSPYQYEYDFNYEKYVDEDKVSFLDVGSGPVSDCGSRSDRIKVNIQAVDPLAYVYEKLKLENNLSTRIHIQYAEVEALTDKFDENQFDIVHMRNALDHSYNPLLGIMQMIYITRIGGKVLLNHLDNEAEVAEYEGLHQWNLEVRNGSFMLWNRTLEINVSALLSDYCDFNCIKASEFSGGRMHMVIIKKNKKTQLFTDPNVRLRRDKIYEKMLSLLLDNASKRKRWKDEENGFCVEALKEVISTGKIEDNLSDYKNVGVYGKCLFSEMLMYELKRFGKEVSLLDRAGGIVSCCGISGIKPDSESLKNMDIIIISPVDYYSVIEKELDCGVDINLIMARDFVSKWI